MQSLRGVIGVMHLPSLVTRTVAGKSQCGAEQMVNVGVRSTRSGLSRITPIAQNSSIRCSGSAARIAMEPSLKE
jgi:hypothetical protein